MGCTGVRQPVMMVSRANDRAVADRFREMLEHFKVIDGISPLVALVLKITFGFIRTALSILSEMPGQDRATIHLPLMKSDLVRSLSKIPLKFNFTRVDQRRDFSGHLYIKWH